jgi:hypothetical protein
MQDPRLPVIATLCTISEPLELFSVRQEVLVSRFVTTPSGT